MSIKEAAYQFCKEIEASSTFGQLSNLLRDLDNRGHIGYYGHREYSQLLGYLMVEQERDRLATMPTPLNIEALPDDERQILVGVQAHIDYLNSQCVAPLTTSFPNRAAAVNPYNKFKYNAPPHVIDTSLLTVEAVDTMITSFHMHPQIEIALESAKTISDAKIAEHFGDEHFTQEVWKLTDSLQSAGALTTPEWIEQVATHTHENAPQRIFARHVGALASLRASLATLNQLIYQKLLQGRLAIIDEDHIIKFCHYKSNGGVKYVFQNAGRLYGVEEGDIVLADISMIDFGTQLCRVEKLIPSVLPPKFGDPRYIELRVVDDNLNPYFLMLHGI